MTAADLTRWNRAGLARFRYVDGNAVTYLEDLRRALAERFPEWRAVGPPPAAPDEDEIDRLLAQYRAPRRDLGWELARSLARACHVLTEHLDAYANEGYLRTATQWESVRRLVALLDVHPAPPSSASTRLALEARGEPGTVAAGFAVRHTPPAGGPPVVFETLADVEVDPRWNALRLAGHGRSPRPLDGDEVELEGRWTDLAAGRPAVVEDEVSGRLAAARVTAVSVGRATTRIRLEPPPRGFLRGRAVVHLAPADALEPRGPAAGGAEIERAVHLVDEVRGLAAEDVVFVSDGRRQLYRRVVRVEGRRLVLDQEVGPLTLAAATVSRARQVAVARSGGRSGAVLAVDVAGDLSALTGAVVADVEPGRPARLLPFQVVAAAYAPVDPAAPEAGGFTTLRLSDPAGRLRNPQSLFVPPPGRERAVDRFLAGGQGTPLATTLSTAAAKKAAAGDLAVVARGRQLAWGRLVAVTPDETAGGSALTVARWHVAAGGPFFLADTTVFAHFRHRARPAGWSVDPTPVSGNRLPLPPGEAAALPLGRALIVERDGAPGAAVAVTVVGRERAAVVVAPPVPAALGLTVDSTVVRGNVALAGHGEGRPEKVLGSGDAARTRQRFVLREAGVSFVADAEQPNGVRAALTVAVEGRIWQQVGSLRHSGPTDFHYTARPTEDGHLEIAFGDGEHGRRLPTGGNNVRAVFRVGTGLAGNLPPGSLARPVRPHPRVAAVTQPLPATGGNEVEAASALRRSAPASVLTLERAVSLADFAHLAGRHSSVWQARAFARPTGLGRRESVEVVVVPAGGGSLGEAAESLRSFLLAHSPPGVEVAVTAYRPLRFHLAVTVFSRAAERVPAEVEEAVRAALLADFALERRRLGQDLFLSEVFATVEAVPGVESSRCVLAGDPALRRLRAGDRDLAWLEPSRLEVRSEEAAE